MPETVEDALTMVSIEQLAGALGRGGLRPLTDEGLSQDAFAKFQSARARTPWAKTHLRRVALMKGDDRLATAICHDLSGSFDQQSVSIRAFGEIAAIPGPRGVPYGRALVARLADAATRDGVDIALLFAGAEDLSWVPDGFDVIPATEAELVVTESAHHGAPMTLVRAGADRDLKAIAAMGRVLGRRFRFHLNRNVDLVAHAITRSRLLAGLAPTNARQLEFVIAEEGITAAAYIVLSARGQTWTVEECGDRDASGARVGAILQALIARDPTEPRPVIHARLPAGFLPPQVTIRSSRTPAQTMLVRVLNPAVRRPVLTADDVLFWHSDLI